MLYNNAPIRRQDRLLDEQAAYLLLQQGEYGVLSLVDPQGRPYGIPANYVWDTASGLSIHCAPEGKKLQCIRQHAAASFCVVGATRIVPAQFSTAYQSIILKGQARLGLPPEERKHAIELILRKYAPDHLEIGLKYAQKSFYRTEIIRFDIQEMSGKSKNIPQ